jgi:hypothetical protein
MIPCDHMHANTSTHTIGIYSRIGRCHSAVLITPEGPEHSTPLSQTVKHMTRGVSQCTWIKNKKSARSPVIEVSIQSESMSEDVRLLVNWPLGETVSTITIKYAWVL